MSVNPVPLYHPKSLDLRLHSYPTYPTSSNLTSLCLLNSWRIKPTTKPPRNQRNHSLHDPPALSQHCKVILIPTFRSREFHPNILLRKSLCLRLQHRRNLFQRHVDLIPNRDEAFRQVHVVLAQQTESEHVVVDVVEYQSTTIAICLFRLEEVQRLVTPVATWVEMMGGVVAVVEAEAIALHSVVSMLLHPR